MLSTISLRGFRFLILSLSLILLGFIYHMSIDPKETQQSAFEDFQTVYVNQYNRLTDLVNEAVNKKNLNDLSWINGEELWLENGIVLLNFYEDSLMAWSANAIPFSTLNTDSLLAPQVKKMKNGWYLFAKAAKKDTTTIGVLLIKHHYDYENQFIQNEFNSVFELDKTVEISHKQDAGYEIKGPKGDYQFSLIQSLDNVKKSGKEQVAIVLYLLAFFAFLLFGMEITKTAQDQRAKRIVLIFYTLVLVGLRYFMLNYRVPELFYQMELFRPQIFAASSFLPSLGDLLLHVVSIFTVAFILYFYSDFKIPISKGIRSLIFSFVLLVLSFLSFVLTIYFFRNLILHSSISFDVSQFFDLSIYSLLGFIVIIVLLATLFLISDKIILILKEMRLSSWRIIGLFLFITVVGYFIIDFSTDEWEWYVFLFYAVFFVSLWFVRKKMVKIPHTAYLAFLFWAAVFSVIFIIEKTNEKEHEQRKVLVVNLANERDQIAEMLLEDIETDIQQDTVIRDLMSMYIQNEAAILDYLQVNYFSGYFRKYDLQTSVCQPGDDLTLILENTTDIVPCYNFFDNLFHEEGIALPGTRFFFLDNLNGKISYLAQFTYKREDWNDEVSLFISLDSKLVSQELGYPELLLDNRLSKPTVLSRYSYAKYRFGKLITRNGDYTYQLVLPAKWEKDSEFTFIQDKEFEHLIYNVDEENVIVISKPKVSYIDVLASFSYIFVLFYLVLSLVLFFRKFPDNLKAFNYDFKNKIKFSMVGLLILSLIIIGAGTVYYNIRQFEEKHFESISEKTQSVLVELEHKLGGETSLDEGYKDYLTYLLSKFSNVFYIDINLYDTNGQLLSSSRPQVFENGLMGEQMDPIAYQKMKNEHAGKFIHKEMIGELSYYSAYVPFTNDNNELLAFLNLPYFTKQSALKREIYTIVIAAVNIYFFLILFSTVIAVLISNNITKPLQMIQRRFREIKLGKPNEPIQYESRDEIGALIYEYNRMAEELQNSAEKLAKSERESAWREMAKQIAHEIKNPLTPMKLNIQYLQKAWNDKTSDFPLRLERFSSTMIEQINSLSAIATAFSDFAKMPKADRVKVDLVERIQSSIEIFESTENVDFEVVLPEQEEAPALVDKKQIMIVFSNLLQNAIQSIPRDREGLITVTLKKDNDYITVAIEDNGKGIPADIQDKLFRPNFTTKSGGMGMGLAIVKNIVENSQGEIWYNTKQDEGTVFYLKLPVYQGGEK